MPPKRAKPTSKKTTKLSAKPTKSVKIVVRKEAPKRKLSSKPVTAAVSKKTSSPATRPRKAAGGAEPLDLSVLPPESVTQTEKWICLACVLDLFTRHMGLAPRTAHLEVKRHVPQVAELNNPAITRPYFAGQSPTGGCPYCGAASKWHARLRVYRIEGGKATDMLRRELVKSLTKSGEQFQVLEEKATRQHAFFEWLDKIGAGLDLDNPNWLREVSLHYLSRKEPKIEWQAQFDQTRAIRRSRRLESGWEVDSGRLFLAPMLFDELLLVQYLVSRSHLAGGLTFEGRYTLGELFVRLRNSGYLQAVGVQTRNPSDGIEQLLDHLSGGESSLKFYHIVDRRDYLATVKAVGLQKPPKPKVHRD